MRLQKKTGMTPQMAEVVIPAVRNVLPIDILKSVAQMPLEFLPPQIRQEHEAVLAAIRKGLTHARNVGELLIQAKAQVAHGGWTDWIAQNCPFSKRSAENYMRIAEHWSEIVEKAQSIADLTINEALALIAKRKSGSPDDELVGAAEGEAEADLTSTPQPVGTTSTSEPQGGEATALEPTQPAENSIGSDGTGANWAKEELPDLSEELEQSIPAITDSLKSLVASDSQLRAWDAEYKVIVADRLEALSRLAAETAAHLRAEADAQIKAEEAAGQEQAGSTL